MKNRPGGALKCNESCRDPHQEDEDENPGNVDSDHGLLTRSVALEQFMLQQACIVPFRFQHPAPKQESNTSRPN